MIPCILYSFHVALAYFGMSFVFLFEDVYRPMYENLNYLLHYVIPTVSLFSIFVLPRQAKPKVKDEKQTKKD